MILDAAELSEQLSGRRLGLVWFNKDARTLLRARAAGLAAFPYSVEHVIDPTLRYRPKVRELANQVIDPKRVVTELKDLERLARTRALDAVVVFETGYEDQPQDHLLEHHPADIDSLAALDAACERDFRNYQRVDPNAEFNARWSKYAVQFVAEYFSNQGIDVLSAYNAPIESVRIDQGHVLTFFERHALLPTIPTELSAVPVRFVLGEDWACGKTSYLLEQMRRGANGLAGDFWFRLVSPDAIPTFQMQDLFAIKGVIANLIRRSAARNPGRPVFIKYDGRLEEFVYGIPRDRTYLVKDLHQFFDDCRFVVVHKADTPRMRGLVERFIAKYQLRADQVDRVRLSAEGAFEVMPG